MLTLKDIVDLARGDQEYQRLAREPDLPAAMVA